MGLRIAFMGTPPFAVPTLDALVAAGHDVVAAYCQPPRPAHRGKRLTLSAVQARAEEMGIAVRSPASLRDSAEQARFAALSLDVAVVAAYGLILPQAILDVPRMGCLNVHGSLLPRWRGAAPVQRAILAGDEETGVTIMQMERGLDTGPMFASSSVPVAQKTAGALTDELAALGAGLMVEVLATLSTRSPTPQPEDGVTYAAKIEKAEALLDFSAPAEAVGRQVRAFAPSPGAWCLLGSERLRVFGVAVEAARGPAGTTLDDRLLVACGEGAVRLTAVQRAGRPRMAAAEFLRGLPVPAGTRLA